MNIFGLNNKEDEKPKTAYCVKCRVIKEARDTTLEEKTGSKGTRLFQIGYCVSCGTKMAKILSRPKTE